jgi:hypothetical protein
MTKNNFILIIILILAINIATADNLGNPIEGNGYIVSKDIIERVIQPGDLFQDLIGIKNTGKSSMSISISASGTINDIIEIENTSLNIPAESLENIYFIIKGIEGEYEGIIKVSGGVNEEIPVKVFVREGDVNVPFLIEISPIKKTFNIAKNISFQITVKKIQTGLLENISAIYTIVDNNDTIEVLKEKLTLQSSTSFIREFSVPEEILKGEYYMHVATNYSNITVQDQARFALKITFIDRVLFGFLPMKTLIWIVSFLLVAGIVAYIIKKRIDSKKKYQMSLDLKSIPKKNKDFLFLGHVAEKKDLAYLDPGRLTTHSIVAGATGGGKSISAQVIIEECLMQNIAVIVFDPTAQWSGMLRKCTDKKMMAYYPKFGLKPKDARAFKGNVRMIKNARQVIDLTKFMTPGQIQIFSLNKLDPKDMDTFIASVIRQIFKSDPKEYPDLKVLFVFDEIHRILPKFGASGEGFLQIERGCREFRKWGLGIMLVSQVLNDFMGAIKANISTAVQMRTRDDGDLDRIKTKHGDEFLQSLVKASAGVGLFENPAYNHANPYFVNFRPILHNTKRLTDEELEEYNKYNDKVDDLEFQIEALEKEGLDTFDLKMEIKLIKDKIMTGSFSVVEIYLEGLTPRVQKEWDKLGKKPPVMKIELVSEEEIRASVAEAQAKHTAEKAKEDAAEAKTTAAAAPKMKIAEKIVKSITFSTGAMISSIAEMREYLPSMEAVDFSGAVNAKKNDILIWVKENFDEGNPEISKSLVGKLKKEEVIAALNEVGKAAPAAPAKEGEAPAEGAAPAA